jgi:DNA-binding beta-propeller fold protein YncE
MIMKGQTRSMARVEHPVRWPALTVFLIAGTLWLSNHGCNNEEKPLFRPGLDTGGDTDVDTDTGPFVDCSSIPQGPFTATSIVNSITGEDFAFDGDGNIVGVEENAVFKVPYEGEPVLFIPDISFDAGMRYLPNGDLIIADNDAGNLLRVTSDGTQHVIASGMSWPNGIAVHPDGWLYVTEFSNGRIQRIEPMTGDTMVVLEAGDDIPNADGITFDEDYDAVYVSAFYEGEIYRMEVESDGSLGEPQLWVQDLGGSIDGLGVDACGNIYACGWDSGAVFRISPDGNDVETIIAPGEFMGMATNINWGTGIGGWDEMSIYISDYDVAWEVTIGVPSKPVVFP